MTTNTVKTNKTQQSISRNKLLGVAGVGWLFDAMDVGILSFVIAALAADWGLAPNQSGWIGSVNSIGMAVGALVFGVFADKVGRKQIFYVDIGIVFDCKWFISVYNFFICIYGFTLFSRHGAWWRASCCLNISF